jgi:hypothetical protein
MGHACDNSFDRGQRPALNLAEDICALVMGTVFLAFVFVVVPVFTLTVWPATTC